MELSSLFSHLPGFAVTGHIGQILPIITALIAASLVVSFVAGMIKKAIGLAIIGIVLKVFVFSSTEHLPTWDELNGSLQQGNISLIENAVRNGANINYQPAGPGGQLGNSLLMSAVGMRKFDMAMQLLQLGANPCVRNSLGQTPLSLLSPDAQKTLPELVSRLAQCR